MSRAQGAWHCRSKQRKCTAFAFHSQLCKGLPAPTTPEKGTNMATRKCRFEMRLTKDEYYDLTKKARKAGMTAASFVRMAVAGKDVMEAPTADVPLLIREVRRVGSDISHLLKIAGSRGFPEASDLQKALAENRTVEKMISEAYGTEWL